MTNQKEGEIKKGQNARILEELIQAAIPELEKVLKTVPPEKLALAKKEAEKIISGNVSWADLSQYTPEKIQKMVEYGYEQFKVGKYDSAERIFRGLTVIETDNYYYHQMLGAVFQRTERHPEAVVEYSIALDLNGEDTVALTNRGEVYFKLGLYEMATADFDRAVKLDPDKDDKWANRARSLLEQIKIMKQRKK